MLGRIGSAVWRALTGRVMIQAVKAAVAASLAWVLVLPLGGVADDYPYYAPLGAVVSVAGTVAASFRATVSSIVAIGLGAVPAVLAVLLGMPELLGIGLVVLVGACLAAWEPVGPMASWVPVSGLFVLIIGQGHVTEYAFAYVSLVGFGALIGLVVDLLWPSLPLHATAAAQDSLRDNLAGQLHDLADGLSEDPLPTDEEWERRRREIDWHWREMSRMVHEAREAQRGNWRARRWQGYADRAYQQARALEQLAFFVEELYDLVSRTERSDVDQVAFGPELRPGVVRALRTMAVALQDVGGAVSDLEQWRRARAATDDLARQIRERQFESSEEFFVAGALVTTLRRALVAVEPPPEEGDEDTDVEKE